MVMAPDPSRLDAVEHAQLVAYLDGELDEDQARAVAAKVAQSQEARREAEALRAAWDLLDLLPRARAPEDFGSRTLTAVTAPSAAVAAGWRGLPLAVGLAATLLATALGYTLARRVWPDPNARLIRQLAMAEHLDEYQDIGTFEFLQLLDQSPEFDDPE